MSLFWRADTPLQTARTLWIDSPRWRMPCSGTLLRLFWSSHTASASCGHSWKAALGECSFVRPFGTATLKSVDRQAR